MSRAGRQYDTTGTDGRRDPYRTTRPGQARGGPSAQPRDSDRLSRITNGHLACVSLVSLREPRRQLVPAAHASTHFSVQIGPWAPVAPVVVAPGPPPGYVWQSGSCRHLAARASRTSTAPSSAGIDVHRPGGNVALTGDQRRRPQAHPGSRNARRLSDTPNPEAGLMHEPAARNRRIALDAILRRG